MSTLDDWVLRACESLDLQPDTLPNDLRNDLLDLTRDVAHGVARVAGPVTCYLAGVAVGRGEPPATVLAALRAALTDQPPPPDDEKDARSGGDANTRHNVEGSEIRRTGKTG